jgi:ADP-ribose pyrophosphatase YjhB (NUDIX family)
MDDRWYRRPPGVPDRTAAGGVVLRRDGERLLVALARDVTKSGLVLPKGSVEPGESLEEAARREIREETGLGDLRLERYLGTRERLDSTRTWWTTTHYFLFETDQVDARPPDPRHPAMVWMPLDDLRDLEWPEQRGLLEEVAGQIRRRPSE